MLQIDRIELHEIVLPLVETFRMSSGTFRNRRSDLPEPREAVVADLTGDGKNDLAVLVHDRIVVYSQE